MTPADEERAHRLGRWLGEWAWNATLSSVRTTIVVVVLAAFWHAVEPGLAFGAWAVVFVALAFVAWPCKIAARALRRTGEALRRGASRRRSSPPRPN